MPGGPKKVPTRCPHCGHTQPEPRGLISTYCRGCGIHYSLAPRTSDTAARPRKKSVIQRLIPRQHRRVICHECRHEHTAAPELGNTLCPACGASIELRDIEITRHSTREIRTQGAVRVAKSGFLNATRISCGSLFVEGRVAGRITCAGTVRLRGHGICRSQITARNLIIDRGAEIRVPSTVYTDHALIRGRLEADIVCAGSLHVGRYGSLDGDVQARAMTVDKGASFLGAVEVSTQETHPRTSREDREEIRILPVWNRGLALSAG